MKVMDIFHLFTFHHSIFGYAEVTFEATELHCHSGNRGHLFGDIFRLRRTHMRRRQLLQLVLPAIFGLLSIPASAQVEQPIRIVYPFAAGGSGDALARMIGDKMRAALGRSVVVENRTGGAGRIGVTAIKNAPPDGSTLLITPIAPMSVYQHVYKSLDYDPINDFAAVSQLATFDFGLAVGSQIPAGSLRQFVAWVKTDTARAAFGGPSTGD